MQRKGRGDRGRRLKFKNLLLFTTFIDILRSYYLSSPMCFFLLHVDDVNEDGEFFWVCLCLSEKRSYSVKETGILTWRRRTPSALHRSRTYDLNKVIITNVTKYSF